MRRLRSWAAGLTCAALLCTGCASDSREESPPVASDPSAPAAGDLTERDDWRAADPAVPTTSALSEGAAAVEEPSEHEKPSLSGKPSQREEPAAVEDSAAPDAPVTAPDQPLGGASVFPPLNGSNRVARWTVEIVESFPHDPEAFTQGLEVAGGTMYESTGLWGQSSLRTVNSVTGEVAARVDLPEEFFGEGLTVVGDEVVQLTWQSETALVYDRFSLELVGDHGYEGEGWGLCLSDDVLIMSDGSNRLAQRDPETFELLGTMTVTAPGYDGRLDYLNELECVEGLVIANVWQTDRLLVIDPESGRLRAAIDAGPLVDDVLQESPASEIDVLNGVALDPDTATLWMTGKLWPRLYRVRVVEVQ